jgi:hypothetical protein
MKYDSEQLSRELASLYHNKELAFQQYHKVCGAIEMVEAMQKLTIEAEKAEQAKLEEAEKCELEPVPETAAA